MIDLRLCIQDARDRAKIEDVEYLRSRGCFKIEDVEFIETYGENSDIKISTYGPEDYLFRCSCIVTFSKDLKHLYVG